MKSPPPFSKLTYALAVFLVIIPAGLLLTLILNYGVDIPYWDEWHYVSFFEKFSQGTLTLGDLFAQQNEYRQFFPNLIFVALGWLTKWNKRYELLVSFALACLVSFNIYRLGRLTIGGSPARRTMVYFLANLLIFSPVQYVNWMLGMQIIYFMPIACLTTCLVIAYSQLGARAKFLLCMCLAAVSTFSSANGILCWLVLPLLTWPNSRGELHNKRWLILAWIFGFVVSAGLYFNGYQKILGHPSLSESLFHPVKALGYFLILLGKALEPGDVIFLGGGQFGTGHQIIAATTGLTVATLFVVSALCIRRDMRLAHRAAGWLMLGTYSIMTAVLVTIGRTGFGVEQAFTPRYTTFTLYLPVALVHLLPIILERHATEGRLAGRKEMLLHLLAGSVVISHLLIYPVNIRQMSAFSKRLSQSKACLLLINVIEEDCLTRVLPNVEYLKLAANSLDGLSFLRPGLIKSSRVQDIAAAGAQNPESYGSLDSVIQTGEDVYTASGWAVLPQRGDAADAILLTYDRAVGDSVIFALADTGAERGVVARILRRSSPSAYAGWKKSFSVKDLPTNTAMITAWAFDARTGKAVQLDGTHVIQK